MSEEQNIKPDSKREMRLDFGVHINEGPTFNPIVSVTTVVDTSKSVIGEIGQPVHEVRSLDIAALLVGGIRKTIFDERWTERAKTEGSVEAGIQWHLDELERAITDARER